jgi:hypothetical protein
MRCIDRENQLLCALRILRGGSIRVKVSNSHNRRLSREVENAGEVRVEAPRLVDYKRKKTIMIASLRVDARGEDDIGHGRGEDHSMNRTISHLATACLATRARTLSHAFSWTTFDNRTVVVNHVDTRTHNSAFTAMTEG